MDNLPKNQTNDWSSYSGKYPTDKPAAGGPPVNGGKAVAPSEPTSPPTTPPAPASSTSEPKFGFSGTSETTPASSAAPFTTTVPAPTSAPAPTPTETPTSNVSTANPFIVTDAPSSSVAKGSNGGGAIRRVLVFLILLIVIGVIGFVAFKVIGGLLSKNQPITLTYWGLWEDEQIMQPVIDEYKNTHPGIDIVYTKQTPKQYRERLQTQIAQGTGPDIFRFHSTWVPMLQSDLMPAAATGYTAAEFQQTFYPVAVRDLVVGGKVYGVPLMIDGLGLYYNEDLLRAAGVTPPTTWEEFRKAALALTVKDQTGQIVTAGAALGTTGNIEHFSDIAAVMMLQNGANLRNPVSKEAQDALSFYRLFAEEPNSVWNNTLDNSIIAFANGRVAMIFAPSWEAFTIRQTNPNLKYQIIPIPQLPGTNVTWASYWAEGVSSKSAHAEAAWEFLRFLSEKEQLITLYTEATKSRALFGEPYSRTDLAQTVSNDPMIGAYIRQAPTAQSFPLSSRTFDNGINDRMIKYLEDAVNSLGKGVGVDAVLQTAAAGFSQVLSSFGAALTQ